jgi:hypothetical protein
MKNILLALLVLLPLQTFAAGYTRLGFMYQSEKVGSSGSTNDVTRTLLDFGAGKVWPNGFNLGFLYGSESNNYASGAQQRTGIGPTVGWMKNKSQGFYIMGTYFVSLTLTGGYKGKGSQIDLGYKFALDKVSIGPQFSQKTFEYNELNGTDLTNPYQDSRIDPYFTVWIDF